jgi:hypothetical protein
LANCIDFFHCSSSRIFALVSSSNCANFSCFFSAYMKLEYFFQQTIGVSGFLLLFSTKLYSSK